MPAIEAMESRVQLSATTPLTYPWDFDGPLPTGAARAEYSNLPSGEMSLPGGHISPMLVTGMSFNPGAPAPVLGGTITAALTYPTTGPPLSYVLASTTWTYDISYGGFTSPTVNLAGSVTTATLSASVPGLYTFTSVTSYVSYNPTAAPPPPTTMTGFVNIAPPDTAIKGGAVNTPTTINTAAQMSDPVYAAGQPIGSMVAGLMQENILAFTYFDGAQSGGNGWYPSAPSAQFQLLQGKIKDQQAYFAGSSWNTLANGGTICNFTQQLRFQWNMSTTAGTNQTFTVYLNSLTWTWVKDSATEWHAQ